MDFGIDPSIGKQIKKSQTFDKLNQARAALRRHKAAKDMGQIVIPRDITLKQWLTTWMDDVVKFSRQSTTVYACRNMIDKHIVLSLGNVLL